MRCDEDGKPCMHPACEHALMTVDNWLQLRVPMQQVAHICCLRHRLTQAFAAKVVLPLHLLHPVSRLLLCWSCCSVLCRAAE